MSWFFGKKKHHRESPPDTPEETVPSQAEDYIIVEKQDNPLSPTSGMGGGLYPYLGDGPAVPAPYPPIAGQHNVLPGESQNYLHGVPFKLSKSFDNDFEIDRLKIDEILSFVIGVKNEDYDYDFSLESSVINEMESGAN